MLFRQSRFIFCYTERANKRTVRIKDMSETKITKLELRQMIKDDHLGKITRNVFCRDCINTTIVGYENSISRNELGDVVLHGICKKCGGEVARYIEAGEVKRGVHVRGLLERISYSTKKAKRKR